MKRASSTDCTISSYQVVKGSSSDSLRSYIDRPVACNDLSWSGLAWWCSRLPMRRIGWVRSLRARARQTIAELCPFAFGRFVPPAKIGKDLTGHCVGGTSPTAALPQGRSFWSESLGSRRTRAAPASSVSARATARSARCSAHHQGLAARAAPLWDGRTRNPSRSSALHPGGRRSDDTSTIWREKSGALPLAVMRE
jgi:hypothetical protein